MNRVLLIIRWIGIILIAALSIGGIWLFQFLTVFGNGIPTNPLTPSITAQLFTKKPIENIEQWEEQKPYIRELFEREIYGVFPSPSISWNHTWRTIDEKAYNDTATVEELVLSDTTGLFRIPIVLVVPKKEGPHPLIIGATFCASHTAFPEFAVEKPAHYPSMCDTKDMRPVIHTILGKYIESFPVKHLIEEGYALASFYTGSFVPDNTRDAPEALNALSSISTEPVTGIISAWAWGYTQVMHALETDSRIDRERIALYGHSRDGKAALLAGAFDESVDAVIAHQSGTGGATPAQRNVGESVSSIMENYPVWFSKQFLSYAGREEDLPVDQHFLVAMMAPRPLLLAGARQDKWADPKGSFMAMRDASFVYELYTSRDAFTATVLTDFVPRDPLAFFMRPLNHGVREADWDAFIQFLNAHFK